MTRYKINIEDIVKDIPISCKHYLYEDNRPNPYIIYETVSKEDFRRFMSYFEISPYAELFVTVTIRKL